MTTQTPEEFCFTWIDEHNRFGPLRTKARTDLEAMIRSAEKKMRIKALRQAAQIAEDEPDVVTSDARTIQHRLMVRFNRMARELEQA